MGRSISWQAHESAIQNREDGRACAFNHSHRATIKTLEDHAQGGIVSGQGYCTRCWNRYIVPCGGVGNNFRIVNFRRYGRNGSLGEVQTF